ncbi:UNVERIFIED_CONTAM: hypothetical protein K2H54_011020 [Gekko kuhli]
MIYYRGDQTIGAVSSQQGQLKRTEFDIRRLPLPDLIPRPGTKIRRDILLRNTGDPEFTSLLGSHSNPRGIWIPHVPAWQCQLDMQICENQHEDVKKQLLDLQLQHNGLKLEHRKALETHSQRYSQLQREKEMEVVALQDTVYKLREESKLLRKAHQDVHSQLLSAQAQMDEFRQLKETLQKMPSFKEVGGANSQQQLILKERPPGPHQGLLQPAREKPSTGNEGKPPLTPLEQAAAPRETSLVAQAPDTKRQEDENLPWGQLSRNNDRPRPQDNVPLGQLAPPHEPRLPLPVWPLPGQKDGHVIRFTRMVNSVQSRSQDQKAPKIMPGGGEDKADSPRTAHGEKAEASEKEPATGNGHEQVVQSWQDIVNKVNAQMDEEQAPRQSLRLPARAEQAFSNHNHILSKQQQAAERRHLQAGWETGKGGADEEELQMGTAFWDLGWPEEGTDVGRRSGLESRGGFWDISSENACFGVAGGIRESGL